MIPERKKIIGLHKVKEYYWARKRVVYVDNKATEETFDEACKRLKEKG